MSPMTADPQFQVITKVISNHDRCNVCGSPRSAHGLDWRCPPGVSPIRGHAALTVCLAGVLVLGGIAWLNVTSTTPTTAGTLAASAFLTALTLLICTLILRPRRP